VRKWDELERLYLLAMIRKDKQAPEMFKIMRELRLEGEKILTEETE